MAITVPTELIGRDDLAMIDGRFASDLLMLSPAFAYKSRLEEVLNVAASYSFGIQDVSVDGSLGNLVLSSSIG